MDENKQICGLYMRVSTEDQEREGFSLSEQKERLEAFCNDLKTIYTAKNETLGYEQLQKVKEKWKDKYPTSLRNWEDNWDAICPFFSYSEPLRKIMYTINTIESLIKCLYLATQNITKK